jgi:hypothetical protein
MHGWMKVIWYIWLYVVMDFGMLQRVNWYMLYAEDIIYCFMHWKLVAYHVLIVKKTSHKSISIEEIQKYWSLHGYDVDYNLFGIY